MPTEATTGVGHALLQSRTARYGLIAGLIGAGFWVSRVVSALTGGRAMELGSASMVAHAVGAGLMFGLWGLCRGPARSARFVRAAELSCIAGACAAYCALVIGLAQSYRPDVKLTLGLAIQLLGRAVYIPSSAQRTAALAGLVTVPFLAAVAWTFRDLDPAFVASLHAAQAEPQSDWQIRFNVVGEDVLWWAAIHGVAVWVSAVIFGLRGEVRRARRLGQYTLEAMLGEGGMGVVYRARHALLRRPTAVKLIHPDRVGEASLTRFEREVRTTATLTHPHTVTIYDYGRTPDGTFYYAMELLDGATLARVVDVDGPMPPGRVARVLAQAAGALAEAHDAGLIHRDIKPENILLTRRGQLFDFAKVVDFGLVKDMEAPAVQELTSRNTIVGTPLYMAPECIRGGPVIDGRSDLYALGAVGYFLLTGQHVFEGDSVIEICGQHLERAPVPPSERRGEDLPEDLERIVLDCLAKPLDERPESARGLERRLRACACHAAWSDADAERWWRVFGPDLSPSERSLDTDTMAVELAGRATG